MNEQLLKEILKQNVFDINSKIIDEMYDNDDKNLNALDIVLTDIDDDEDCLKTLKILIKNGENTNKKNKFGETAIFSAATRPSSKCLEFLILQGANVNEINNDGESPLFLAALSENKKNMEVLINAGANTDLAIKKISII